MESTPDNLACKIEAYSQVNPSEDPQKVQQAVSNVIIDAKIKTNENSLKASSKSLKSLSKIYEAVHTRKLQKTYRTLLNKNLVNESTWLYLNKQAAFVGRIALCETADESPLGPIKIILLSENIQQVIEWLVSDSE